jgi:hypothetical protein
VLSAPYHPSKGLGHARSWSAGVLHKKTTGKLQMLHAHYRAAAAAAAAAAVGLHPLATALEARTVLLRHLLKLLARLGSALSQLRNQEGVPQQPRRERRRLKLVITLPLLPPPMLPYRPGVARTDGGGTALELVRSRQISAISGVAQMDGRYAARTDG